MAVAFRITIDASELEQTFEALRLDRPRGRAAVGRALDRTAFRVQRNATQEQIIRGGRQAPHPTRLTSRTGTLRRSVRVNRRGFARSIGTDLVYGMIHELGLGRYPKRAYLEPALREEGRGLADDIAIELQREIDRA